MVSNIEAVAKHAGVATSTVSLVLRNKPRVSQAKRDAVLEAVRELGYKRGKPGRPRKKPGDPITNKQTNRIAMIFPDISPARLYTPIYVDLIQGIEKSVHIARKSLMLRYIQSAQRTRRAYLPSRVDGVLLFRGTENEALIKQLAGTPVVQLMNVARKDDRWDRVTLDNDQVGRIAAKYAHDNGHVHAAFVGRIASPESFFLQKRGLDFQRYFSKKGGTVQLVLHDLIATSSRVNHVRRDAMEAAAAEIKKMRPKPTLLLVESDIVTFALYPALQAQGLIPGKDVQILSCNYERPWLAHLYPRPAVINFHAETIGKKAVERLLWRIQNPDAPVENILVKPSLVLPEDMDID